MFPNELGNIVIREWEKSASIRKDISLDSFIVMPNHLHGIVWIKDNSPDSLGAPPCDSSLGAPPCDSSLGAPPCAPTGSLGAFIKGFKQSVTIKAREAGFQGIFWQKRYYDHIVRNEEDLGRIREYILTNPKRWGLGAKTT